MIIKLLNKDGVIPPAPAHESDTGSDVIAISEPKIVGDAISEGVYKSISYIEYDTGLQISPPGNYLPIVTSTAAQPSNPADALNELIAAINNKQGYTLIYPRSSISKYNLTLANGIGLIDPAFRGNLVCRFKYHIQPEDLGHIENVGIVCVVNKDKIYKKGDKCAQLVAAWKEKITWQLVDKLDETARGEGGFGSSDKIKSSGSIV